jgi:hypothetical protein
MGVWHTLDTKDLFMEILLVEDGSLKVQRSFRERHSLKAVHPPR